MEEIEIILKVVLKRTPDTYDMELFKTMLIHTLPRLTAEDAVRRVISSFKVLKDRADEISRS